MKQIAVYVFLLIICVSCATVPITGRKSINIIPVSTINSMSFQQYGEFLRTNKLSNNRQQTEMIKRVGKKIQSAVEDYFEMKGMASHLKNYEWEFNLVEDDAVNAWAMPGGKVIFYTGILPYTKDETGIAVVMGHEIAHIVAGHGNERMSQGLLTQLGGMALSKALEEKPEKSKQLFMTAFGLGAQYGVLLPYSRLHENEADHLGLIFMAMAGYNPQQAISFWQRMSAMKSGQAPPEFLSTHPSDATRINNMKKLMPEAMEYYRN